MKLLTTVALNWFNDGCCDVKYLDVWDEVGPNYQPGQSIDASWRVVHDEHLIGRDASGRLFQAATEQLMRYQIYPQAVMSHASDFDLWERPAQVGDRIIQRTPLIRLFNRSIVDAVTMSEVTRVIYEPRCCRLSYVTTKAHVLQGEWTATVRWQENDDVLLIIDAISRPVANEPKRNYRIIRTLQERAHRLGVTHFVETVKTAITPASLSQ